ncbi:heavy metal-binding protein HIP-like [Liolophura sinensis]|uniref:heavy metal-binding protein HIP-like n=1 Tax=Liolophura sinensis TaxID=3198878 RepID=UPI0031581F4E
MATLSGTCVTLVILLADCSLGANLTPNGRVVEDPSQNAAPPMTLGTIRTLNLAHPQGESVCDWNTRITQFLLDETKDRLELKFNLEKKINELYEQIEQMKSLFVKEEEEISGNMSARLQGANTVDAVAFSAQVESHLTGLTRDQTIVFSSPRTNLGNAYNSKTGVFTCPTAGLYLFTATVLSNLGDRIETEIMLHKSEGDMKQESVAKLYSGAASTERYGSGSNTVVLELAKGDTVWLREYNGLGSFVYQQWSSFSGALIQRL